MRVLGINASQRKDGNSYQLLKAAFEGAKGEDKAIETEMLQLTDLEIKPCKACYSGVQKVNYYGCAENPHKCIIEDDDFEDVFQKMVEV